MFLWKGLCFFSTFLRKIILDVQVVQVYFFPGLPGLHPVFYEITLERVVLILSWDSNLVTRRHWDIYSQQWNTMGISVYQCIPYIMINPSWILVGGLEHFSFFHILGIIIPTDELIFFRGVGQPFWLKPFWGLRSILTEVRQRSYGIWLAEAQNKSKLMLTWQARS